MAAGESQILDETADLENDFNDTTTLGGFIADDTTLNETGDGTNWTLGKKNSLQITLKFQNINIQLTNPTITQMLKRMNRMQPTLVLLMTMPLTPPMLQIHPTMTFKSCQVDEQLFYLAMMMMNPK